MLPKEREHLVELLVLFTGWNRSVFESLTDEQVEKLYEEKVSDRTPRRP